MHVKEIMVTEANMPEVIKDETVYVIKKSVLFGQHIMMPIGSADIRDLMSNEVLFVRIIEE